VSYNSRERGDGGGCGGGCDGGCGGGCDGGAGGPSLEMEDVIHHCRGYESIICAISI